MHELGENFLAFGYAFNAKLTLQFLRNNFSASSSCIEDISAPSSLSQSSQGSDMNGVEGESDLENFQVLILRKRQYVQESQVMV